MEKLIVKYITNSITENELEELVVWLNTPENEELFLDYLKVNYAIDYNVGQFRIDKTKKMLFDKIDEDINKVYKSRFCKYLNMPQFS